MDDFVTKSVVYESKVNGLEEQDVPVIECRNKCFSYRK